jgi:hypothetical protein
MTFILFQFHQIEIKLKNKAKDQKTKRKYHQGQSKPLERSNLTLH